jgi:putative nucleotidyltransferase with HDIG domain
MVLSEYQLRGKMKSSKKYKFLIVEDDFPVLKILSDILKLSPFVGTIYTTDNGEHALELFKENSIDVIITDILMPKITGLELIKKIREYNTEAHIIVISAYGNTEYLREAIRNGAYDYILKPFTVDEILFSVNRVIEKLNFLEERKNYVISLENAVKETREKLEKSFYDSLKSILNALEARDRRIYKHCHSVSIYSEKLARKMALDKKTIEKITIGALLHDIGKLAVPDNILLKDESELKREEFELLKQHPVIGKNIVLPVLKDDASILNIIFYHHEKFDGSGYPEGLRGEKIPLEAKIVSIVNYYDKLENKIGDNDSNKRELVIEELKKSSSKISDPEILKIFLSLLE